jgi:sugar lactone lactonase YvrE
MRPAYHTLAALLLSALHVSAQAPPAPPAAPAPKALWTVTADMAAPESAYYDAASNSVFVSNINGQILEKDGNGYISRLTPDGKVVNAKWATGLNAPKGIRSVKGTLWVSDIDEVVGIEISSGRIASRVRVEGALFLNDLATAADGTIYVSDSNQSRIYAVRDGKSSVFVEGADLVEQANGLLVDGNRLVLGTIGPAGGTGRGRGRGAAASGRLLAFDLKTKTRTQLTKEPVGGIDGIEPDGKGGYLITDVFGSRLLHVDAKGATRTLLTFPQAGADFGYVPGRRLAVVPFLFGNSVGAYELDALIK